MPAAELLRFVSEKRPDVIGISAIFEANVESARQLIAQLRSIGPRRVTILAGGRPFVLYPELWREIGADGSAADAAGSVETAEKLTAIGSST
jgi:methanogenic corrinoid protein MtbC1